MQHQADMGGRWAACLAIAVALASICGAGLPTSAQSAPTAELALATQVLLDRARFSPLEIDGTFGPNTMRAAAAFAQARGVRVEDAVATATDPPTVTYMIDPEDVRGPFVAAIPEDMMAKAALPRLAYTSPLELLAERFHVHGTPEPGAIGHTASHGCVRLTNWDASAVATLGAKGTRVVFVE